MTDEPKSMSRARLELLHDALENDDLGDPVHELVGEALESHDQHAKRAHDLANRVQVLEFQKLVDDKIREELARLLAAIFPEDLGTHVLDLVGTQLEVSDAIARVERLRGELTKAKAERDDFHDFHDERVADLLTVTEVLDEVRDERDKALRELLAPTGPRYSAANIALDPDETGESD